MARIQLTEEEARSLHDVKKDRGETIHDLLVKHGCDPEKPWRVDTHHSGDTHGGEIRTGRNIGRPPR
jgi:hypothetical protein